MSRKGRGVGGMRALVENALCAADAADCVSGLQGDISLHTHTHMHTCLGYARRGAFTHTHAHATHIHTGTGTHTRRWYYPTNHTRAYTHTYALGWETAAGAA